ncbi:hypothetical protein [Parablautia muri]|uniref:Uncharacterized protein n=1 Tax=Parablautia muri TaxID=2320879 RepID=A0A9X5BF35_9FIRM|nr:hypothetical protein [Parablautia muri]NBJ92473.1 hypothetical protein [Parablautia muri]
MKKNQAEMNIADNLLYHDTWELLTEATKGKKAVWHTCLEKMLVDMTAEKVIKTTFSEAEYPNVLKTGISQMPAGEFR